MQAVVAKWKEFDFPTIHQDMRTKCQQIEESKRLSLESKKKLAEDTRLIFRRDDPLPQEFQSLLKSYQLEIDSLSRRAKVSETYVQQLTTSVALLSDFTQQLDRAVEVSRDSSEVSRLKSQIRDLEREFSEVTNQAVTVRRLEQELKQTLADREHQIAEAIAKTEQQVKESLMLHREQDVTVQSRMDENLKLAQTQLHELTEKVSLMTVASAVERQRFESALKQKDYEIDYLSRELESTARNSRTTVDDTVSSTLLETANRKIDQQSLDIQTLQTSLHSSSEQTTHLQQELSMSLKISEQLQHTLSTLEARSMLVEPAAPSLVAWAPADAQLNVLTEELENLKLTLKRKSDLIAEYETHIQSLEHMEISTSRTLTQIDQLSQQTPLHSLEVGDRLKARASELESERDMLKKQVEAFKYRSEELYSDNVKLTEQRRYWQTQARPQQMTFVFDSESTNEQMKEGPERILVTLLKIFGWKGIFGYFVLVHFLLALLLVKVSSLAEQL